MVKSTVKGSYTVEAALLLPCIIFIVIGLLYLGFYMHDKVKLQAILNESTIKGRALIQQETDINTGVIDYETYYQRGIFYYFEDDLPKNQNEIYEYLNNKLSSGFFLAKINIINVMVTSSNIKIEVGAQMEIPFWEVRNLFLDSNLTLSMGNSAELHNPTEFIRIFNVFSGVAEKTEIVDETLKKLQKVLNKFK